MFKPLRSGTVGVIDGRYQYVLDLGTGKGVLRPINEAPGLGRRPVAEQPAEVEKAGAAIYAQISPCAESTGTERVRSIKVSW